MWTDGDDADHTDTWTREQLLTRRGYPDSVVQRHKSPELVTGSSDPVTSKEIGEDGKVRTCALPGCRKRVEAGRPGKRYCSVQCQRKAAEARRHARTTQQTGDEGTVAAQVVAGLGLVPNETAASSPAKSEWSPFAAMASLAGALPVGWRLELAAGQACLRWTT
jgi:hypothetical protein